MTMHLDRSLTTTSTKKRKRKLTKNDMMQYQENCRIFNKNLKRAGRHSEQLTLDEYIDFCHGIIKERPKKNVSFEPYTPVKTYRRETPSIPSLGNGIGIATKKDSIKYTGTLIKGIATMHKSNAVPVLDDQQAIEISRMRRG